MTPDGGPIVEATPSAASAGIAEGLRIALFSGNYNCVRDGANKALNKLVAFLIEEGAAVRVYSPTSPKPAFEPSGDLISVPSFPLPGRSEYRVAPRLTRKIKEDVRRFDPTHFHLSAPDFLGTSAQNFAKSLGVPIVASLHTRFEAYLEYYNLSLLSGWMQRRLDRFYGGSDYILTPNEALADGFRAKGMGSKVGIWGRGVNRNIFNPARRDMVWRRGRGYGDEEPVVLFFGRLVAEKGLDVFADMIHLLEGRGRKLRPLVVGEGPAYAMIKSRLPTACFTGHLEGPDLGRAVASADILVNPSVTEAFGNVNLEAMASGLAVVSADVDSARALATHENEALLVSPKDPEAYADAVELLIEHPDMRRQFGERARAASADYVWPKILASVVAAYRLTDRRN